MDLNTHSIVRTTLEVLRSVFLGAASRHDAVRNRWVIAEGGYQLFLAGPDNPEPGNKVIASRSFELRDSVRFPVTIEQKEQILQERPDAKLTSYPDDSQIFYIAPPIHSRFNFYGNHAARDAFLQIASDAGLCLLRILQLQKLSLKLPPLVPIESIADTSTRSGSTNLPTKLTERWLGFLHILGWQNLDLSPLRAERAIWHGSTSILGDPAELHRTFGTPEFEDLRELIPFPPRYFASTIDADLNLASVYAIDSLLSELVALPCIDIERISDELKSIRPGRDDAARFHAFVKDLLVLIFAPELFNPIAEDRLHEGRGRIDIVFTNGAEMGYFADLSYRHNIICPVVFFECKNYSDDIGGNEFAQLTARFSDRRCKVGFIVCRSIDDTERVQKRCKDCFHARHEHVVVLTDNDLIAMAKLKSLNDSHGISAYLRSKFHPIFMDA